MEKICVRFIPTSIMQMLLVLTEIPIFVVIDVVAFLFVKILFLKKQSKRPVSSESIPCQFNTMTDTHGGSSWLYVLLQGFFAIHPKWH